MSIPNIKQTQSILYFPSTNKGSSEVKNYSMYNIIEKAFQHCDQNKSGQLDFREFSKFLQLALKNGLISAKNGQTVYQFIKMMDKNNDKLISKKQLHQFFRLKQQGKVNTNAQLNQNMQVNRIVFNPKTDNIPTITPKILTKVQQQQIVNRIQQIYKKYDDNNSGYLDYNELSHYLKEQLKNKYSYIEFAELAGMRGGGLIGKKQMLTFFSNIRQ